MTFREKLKCARVVLLGLMLQWPYLAQAAVTARTDAINTTVNLSGSTYTISAGTINGSNLFHSFDAFNITSTQTANFTAAAGGISNVIGRIFNGQSSIDGIVSMGTNLTNANLYLINPAGFLFGANASINIAGSFHATSADYVELGSATNVFGVTTPIAEVLTSAAPSSFGFLDNTIGAISTASGASITVGSGQTISLVGGDITLTGANLTAASGQITLASVATITDPGTPTPGKVTNVTGSAPVFSGVATQGAITIESNSVVSVDGVAAEGGEVYIRGGSLTMTGGSTAINADNNSSTTDGGLIDINVTGAFSMNGADIGQNNSGDNTSTGVTITADSITMSGGIPTIHADTSGAGDAGDITLLADTVTFSVADIISQTTSQAADAGDAGDITVTATTTATVFNQYFYANTTGFGDAGTIRLLGGDWTLTGGTRIHAKASTGAGETGNAGGIIISTSSFDITGSTIESTTGANSGATGGVPDPDGNAGSITITSADIDVTGTTISTSTGAGSVGDAGNIALNGHNIDIDGGSTITSDSSAGSGRAGIVSVLATMGVDATQTLTVDNSEISTNTSVGDSIIGASVDSYTWLWTRGTGLLTNGAKIKATTSGDGDAGYIFIQQGDWTFTGAATEVTSSQTNAAGLGDAGLIQLGVSASAPLTRQMNSLIIENGATVSSDTVGTAGTTGVDASNAGIIEIRVINGMTVQSGATISSNSDLGIGNAGDITIYETDTFTLDGAEISTKTSEGIGGNISIDATTTGNITNGDAVVPATEILATSDGAGVAGNISITGGAWTIDGDAVNGGDGSEGLGSTVVSSSQTNAAGTGAAGNIDIDVTSLVVQEYAVIKSNTINSAGGIVTLDVSTTGQINSNAQVTTNTSGSGDAGSIFIDSADGNGDWTIDGSGSLVASNQTDATATGNAGNITVDVATLALTNSADIESKTSSSTSSDAGNVIINADDGIDDSTTNDLVISGGSSINTLNITGTGGMAGDSGDITITTGTMLLDTGYIVNFNNDGAGGNLTITADYGTVTNSSLIRSDTVGTGNAGNIDINSGAFDGTWTVDGGSSIASGELFGNSGSAGNIDIDLANLTIEGTNTLIGTSTTTGTGDAGNIDITTSGNLIIQDDAKVISDSDAGSGSAGAITIASNNFTLDGGEISTKTNSGATQGNISINATTTGIITNGDTTVPATLVSATTDGVGQAGAISITGGAWTIEGENVGADGSEGLGSTVVSSSSTGSGAAGDIGVNVNSLVVTDYAQVKSDTINGTGGNVSLTVATTGTISANAEVTANTTGTGTAGNINLDGGDLTIDGATVSSSQTQAAGSGDAGNILIDVNRFSLLNNGTVSSSTLSTGNLSDAGTITILADDGVDDAGTNDFILTGGSPNIITNAQAGGGKAGDITITTGTMFMVTGDIFAKNRDGAGGIISITADYADITGVTYIRTDTTGTGTAGNILFNSGLNAGTWLIDGNTDITSTALAGSSGDAGRIVINLDTLTVDQTTQLSTSTVAGVGGNAGQITINNTTSLTVQGGSFISSDADGTGEAGAISVTVPTLTMNDGDFTTETTSGAAGAGLGSITINATTVANISNGSLISASTVGSGQAGLVTLNGPDWNITGVGTKISSDAGSSGDAGDVDVVVTSLLVENSAEISSDTASTGDAGTVTITATDVTVQSSGIVSSNSTMVGAGAGAAGSVAITADDITISGGTVTTTTVDGAGGNVTLNATSASTGLVTAAGSVVTDTSGNGLAGDILFLGPNWIFNGGSTISSSATGIAAATGAAGTITANVGSFLLNGASIQTNSATQGVSGNISIIAAALTLAGGGSIASNTTGAGNGGFVSLNSGTNVVMTGGSQVSTTTSSVLGSAGNAGDIFVNAVSTLSMTDSTLTSSTTGQGDAGSIFITTGDLVYLLNSSVFADATGGFTVGGGNLTVNTGILVLDSSLLDVSAASFASGGNVIINADFIFASPDSVIDVSSAFGSAGSLTLNAVAVDLSSGLNSLKVKFQDASRLIHESCSVKRVSSSSSFVVNPGIDGLPDGPDGFQFSSPLNSGAFLRETSNSIFEGINPVALSGSALFLAASICGGI